MDLEDLKVLVLWAAILGFAFLVMLMAAGVLGLATVIYKEVAGF